MSVKYINTLILGDSQVGKTTWLKYEMTGEFTKKYEPTTCPKLESIKIYTNIGPIDFYLTELSLSHLEEYANKEMIHGVFIFFDWTKAESFFNVQKYLDALHKWGKSDLVIGLIGNKIDLPKDDEIPASPNGSFKYFDESKPNSFCLDISCKSDFNMDKILIKMAQHALAIPNLTTVMCGITGPPQFEISLESFEAQSAAFIQLAHMIPLPEEDEEI